MDQPQRVPHHIAIIMDGNGRWAVERGLPRMLGHRAGAEAVRRVTEAACELGVRALTLYAFSWENWDRSREEVRDLMALLDEFVIGELPSLERQRIRLSAIGRLEHLPPTTLANLRYVMDRTAACDRMTLTLALSYGGRQELVDAARRLAEEVRAGVLQVEQIDEACVAQRLYTADLPDPDLLIRTSGEQRLSNFLLWQASYTEFHVSARFWPDFSKADLQQAIADYERRDRRFGRTERAADLHAGGHEAAGRGGVSTPCHPRPAG